MCVVSLRYLLLTLFSLVSLLGGEEELRKKTQQNPPKTVSSGARPAYIWVSLCRPACNAGVSVQESKILELVWTGNPP